MFESKKCFTCGTEHELKCPYIKAYEYYPVLDAFGNAILKRVEFVTFADFHKEVAPSSLPAHTTRQ